MFKVIIEYYIAMLTWLLVFLQCLKVSLEMFVHEAFLILPPVDTYVTSMFIIRCAYESWPDISHWSRCLDVLLSCCAVESSSMNLSLHRHGYFYMGIVYWLSRTLIQLSFELANILLHLGPRYCI